MILRPPSASRRAGRNLDRGGLPSRPTGIADPKWAAVRGAWADTLGSPISYPHRVKRVPPVLRRPGGKIFHYGPTWGAKFAKSTIPSRDSVWRTLTRICRGWGWESPLPLTVAKVDAVGATLKAGRYASHTNYLSRLVSEAERRAAIVDPIAVHRARKDAERSCAIGLGGSEKGRESP